MRIEEITKILEEHRLWIFSEGREGKRAVLIGANLEGANLVGANLVQAVLLEANLRKANLRKANLREVFLEGANLREANLIDANLIRADLTGSNLREAALEGANLGGATLKGANLDGIKGKEIFTFQAGQDVAYAVDGDITIGCKTLPSRSWIKMYEEVGADNYYTKQDIEDYGDFIKWAHKRMTK